MITKGGSLFLKNKAVKDAAILTYASQRNFSGGGPKKPAMPATETNFDIVLVGTDICVTLSRWKQCNLPPQVHPN